MIPKQWVSRAMCLRCYSRQAFSNFENDLRNYSSISMHTSFIKFIQQRHKVQGKLEMGYLVHYTQDSLPFSNSLSSSLRWFSSCLGGFEAWNEMLTILWEMLFVLLWAEQGANIKIYTEKMVYRKNIQ